MASLYVIPTPIGNLDDITYRAVQILRDLGVLFCEDTRITAKLVNHFELGETKLISCNKENEASRIKQLLNYLDEGKDVGLVSDAGMPLVSDPGALIANAFYEHNLDRADPHKIIPLAGASSLTTALAACPIDTSSFVYEGFLPHGPKQRRRVLRDLVSEERPIVFFESPHRIISVLEDIQTVFAGQEVEDTSEARKPRKKTKAQKIKESQAELGDTSELSNRPAPHVYIARELTKKFEQFYYGEISEIIVQLKEQFPDKVQGEFVMVVK